MRQVIVSHLVAQELPNNGTGSVVVKYVCEPKGQATFHQFGVGYEESENDAGDFSTAIVEWPDGSVEMVRADFISFIDSPELKDKQ